MTHIAEVLDRRPRYRHVLFDWDGCLAQTLDIWMTAFETTFGKFGLFPGRKAIAGNFGDWHAPKALGITGDDYERFNEMVSEAVSVELPGVMLYPGAHDLVTVLKAEGLDVGLITSSASDNVREALINSGLREYLDIIVTANDVTHHKPHPEPIELALTALDGRRGDAVMIGDSTKDIGAANAAGIDSILVYPEAHEIYYDLEELKSLGPTHVCSSFEDVKKVLLPSG